MAECHPVAFQWVVEAKYVVGPQRARLAAREQIEQ